jgi:hypothetical protein
MLLASIEGSIGMRCAFASGRRTGEPGQQARQDGGPGVPIRPNSPTLSSCGLQPIPVDGSNRNRPL